MISRKQSETDDFRQTHRTGLSQLRSSSIWIKKKKIHAIFAYISEDTVVNTKISLHSGPNCTHVHVAYKLFCLPACFQSRSPILFFLRDTDTFR